MTQRKKHKGALKKAAVVFLAVLMLTGCSSHGSGGNGTGTDGTSTAGGGHQIQRNGFYPEFNDNEDYSAMRDKLIKKIDAILEEGAPFSMYLNDKSEDIGKWSKEITKSEKDGSLIINAVYTDPTGTLRAEVDATVYADSPTVDYTVHIKNTSDGKSPVISALNGIDVAVDLPKKDGNYVLNTTQGCGVQGSEDYDDFGLETYKLLTASWRTFKPNQGRSSDEAWPFFDILGDNCGLLLAVGWSGQWKAKFRERDGKAVIQAGMERLNTYLEPGEEIRTPSYSVTYFDGTAEYGHNIFRRLILKHYTPDTGNAYVCRLPLSMCSLADRTEAVFKSNITSAIRHGIPTDGLVVDAGWYTDAKPGSNGLVDGSIPWKKWYYQAGNWSFNKTLFPNGNLKSLSQLGKKNGIGISLWLEPERAHSGTDMVINHRDLYFREEAGGVHLLNLGKDEARDWLIGYISDLIEENGLSVYRQDFNMTPMWFWNNEYPANRLGIAEIRYIEGLYHVFDTIRERYPSVLIDSCASGGRRIDIEILKRSVVLWRTDYPCNTYGENFFDEGTQFQMQSLSYWLPLHATGVGTDKFTSYNFRSALAAGMNFNSWITDENAADAKFLVSQAKKMRPYYYGDYYQILDPRYDFKSWQAYEVYREDMGEGALVVYIRENVKETEKVLCLKGLDPAAKYRVTDSDGVVPAFEMSGEKLMTDGFAVSGEPRSALVFYIEKI